LIKNGGYLTMQIRLLNGRVFNRILSEDKEALYSAFRLHMQSINHLYLSEKRVSFPVKL